MKAKKARPAMPAQPPTDGNLVDGVMSAIGGSDARSIRDKIKARRDKNHKQRTVSRGMSSSRKGSSRTSKRSKK